MKDLKKTCKVALVQAAPIMFDKTACTQKAVELTAEAAAQNAELIVFPGAFHSRLPLWHDLWLYRWQPKRRGPQGLEALLRQFHRHPRGGDGASMPSCKEAGAFLSIGVSERDPVTATLYNSNLFFSPTGELLSVHRKLKPTGAERVVWGDADRDYFPVEETPWGVMGSLICWESYMPLARVALYQKGVSLYISPNTNDNEEWQATIRHIAIEGHCFFINSDMYFTKEMYPAGLHCPEEIAKLPDTVCRGGSCIVDPYGHYVTEPSGTRRPSFTPSSIWIWCP